MSKEDQDLLKIKDTVFNLICQIESQLTDNIKAYVDPHQIASLAKLIDSFVRLSNSIPNKQEKKTTELLEEDINLLKLYNVAPRAGFEPATKRLTAACSTTELPRNNVLEEDFIADNL